MVSGSRESGTEDIFVDLVEKTHNVFLSFRLCFHHGLSLNHNGPHDSRSPEKASIVLGSGEFSLLVHLVHLVHEVEARPSSE